MDTYKIFCKGGRVDLVTVKILGVEGKELGLTETSVEVLPGFRNVLVEYKYYDASVVYLGLSALQYKGSRSVPFMAKAGHTYYIYSTPVDWWVADAERSFQ